MMLILDDQICIIPNLASQPLILHVHLHLSKFLELIIDLEAIEAEVIAG